ncbi:MAG: hypothetical protein IH820_18300 [Bacteroidetes bacterium]|nr:hypothetical protein [Bacteroidota bacterium]
MNPNRLPLRLALVMLALSVALPGLALRPSVALGQQIPSPESFFGFEMGADRKLARWDKLVEYYNLLDSESPRLQVVNMGPSIKNVFQLAGIDEIFEGEWEDQK